MKLSGVSSLAGVAGVAISSLLLSGCSDSGSSWLDSLSPSTPSAEESARAAEPLSPTDAAIASVLEGEPNAGDSPGAGVSGAAALGDSGAEAIASSRPSTPRERLAGAWRVEEDSQCRVILAFTRWSGGYRAASRRCSSREIASVSAWDVRGEGIFLFDSQGESVAILSPSPSAPNRYEGVTSQGESVILWR